MYGANDLEAYRKRVTHYIREHQSFITTHKLTKNIPTTATELDTLDKMLFEQGEKGKREQFEKAYGEEPLGKFLRSIVGLEMDAAKRQPCLLRHSRIPAAMVLLMYLIPNKAPRYFHWLK